jgi:hypothetical protein
VSLQTRLADLATAVATDVKQLRTWISGSSSGNLSGLTTTEKASIVGAINEVNAKPTSGAPNDATESVKGIVELATLAEVAAGADTTLVVTPAGVRQERIALKEEILGAGLPAALDTLEELANALGDDANFAATVTTALAARVRTDTAAQGLTTQEKLNARTNIDAVALAAIGDPEADLVAVYAAAKA